MKHDRWHTAIVDAAGAAGLLAHIDGRTAASVADWLTEQPDWWKATVTHVSVDLSGSYANAKSVRDALPDAVLVADKFHLVALGNQMLTEVRQHATRTARGRSGRKKDPEWAARRRLLLGRERHTDASFTSAPSVEPAVRSPSAAPRTAGRDHASSRLRPTQLTGPVSRTATRA